MTPAHRLARHILLGVALALASATFAQQAPPTPSPEVQKRIAAAKARLQLTPDQEVKLRSLLEEEAQKVRSLQAKRATDDPPTKAEMGREARAIREDFRGKLKALLTPEQMTEWDKMVAERRAAAKERRQENR